MESIRIMKSSAANYTSKHPVGSPCILDTFLPVKDFAIIVLAHKDTTSLGHAYSTFAARQPGAH
jgi:hypothetical protein